MRRLRPPAAEAVESLASDPVHALGQLGLMGEAAALPWIVPRLLCLDQGMAQAACGAATQILRAAPQRDFGWIEQTVRGRLRGNPSGATSWWHLSAAQLPCLLVRLNDWVAPVQRLAAEKVSTLLRPESVPDLLRCLALVEHDRGRPVRREALLAFLPSHPELEAALCHPCVSLRGLVRHALRKRANLDFPEYYRQVLISGTAPRQLSALAGLGGTGTRADVPTVLPYVSAPAPKVRAAALRALGRLDPEGSLEVLTSVLTDSSSQVVRAAVEVIGKRVALLVAARLLGGIPGRAPRDRLSSPLRRLESQSSRRGKCFTRAPRGQEFHLHEAQVIQDRLIPPFFVLVPILGLSISGERVCAGINRPGVGDERALHRRRSEPR